MTRVQKATMRPAEKVDWKVNEEGWTRIYNNSWRNAQ